MRVAHLTIEAWSDGRGVCEADVPPAMLDAFIAKVEMLKHQLIAGAIASMARKELEREVVARQHVKAEKRRFLHRLLS